MTVIYYEGVNGAHHLTYRNKYGHLFDNEKQAEYDEKIFDKLNEKSDVKRL